MFNKKEFQMKTLENDSFKIFKGAGFLIGFAMAIVQSIVVFVISNNFTAAISAALPIGIVMGLGLEQRFQRKGEISNPIRTKTMLISLITGLFIFFILFIFIKII